MSFLGFPRKDGSVGVRNHIGIISVVVCANDVTLRIAQQVEGAVAFLHDQGCCQTPIDLNQITKTLINLGKNPNLAGVLLVSLGCESVLIEEIREKIAASGKPVKTLAIQQIGGMLPAVAEGCRITQEMVIKASTIRRESFDDFRLSIGVKCGASDTTSGLISNPAAGAAFDILCDHGGTCVFGETTEFLGAEHILMRRAATPEVKKKIGEIVNRMEQRAKMMGVDMRGGQPTTGNIKGGLTTIEEKSLGAIVKGGTKSIQGVYEYGDKVTKKGLYIVDSPGREPEFLTGVAAAGVQIIIFSTGIGAPQGFPFVPVLKITGNPKTEKYLSDHIDKFIKLPEEGENTIAQAGEEIYEEIKAIASGKKTKAEVLGYGQFSNIFTIGPVI
ncbi:MAG: UxaA family hydrolase [Candidatus Caldatribacteriota bacterium]|nr:UxaA family hydrolase [Candidatus Caldatribacteriota bacterium]